jgi:hypothetical protein
MILIDLGVTAGQSIIAVLCYRSAIAGTVIAALYRAAHLGLKDVNCRAGQESGRALKTNTFVADPFHAVIPFLLIGGKRLHVEAPLETRKG